MKVIYLNRYFYPDNSASSQILSELVFDLAERGYDIHVITSRTKYEGGRIKLPVQDKINGVVVHRISSTGFGRGYLPGRLLDYLSFLILCAWKVFRIADRDDIIVAKTDPPLLSLLIAPVVKMKKARFINWLQDIFPEIAARIGKGRTVFSPLYGVLRKLRNLSLQTAEINVVPGERMAEHLTEEGISEDLLYVIPNWSDGKVVYPVEKSKNRLRNDWGLSDKFVVGYSGNFGLAHEFEGLIEAAEILQNRDESIIFLFIGAGYNFNRIQKALKKKNINNILLKPYQSKEDLAQSLSVPDVHLISLKPELEGLIIPSKFYGIAAAGRPTIFIGDNKGEISSLLNQSDTGLVVKPGQGEELVKAILNLKQDIEKCTLMGQKARSIFLQKYEKKFGVQRWDVLLSNIRMSGKGEV